MFCDNCGAENRDNANFCYRCSHSLSHIADAAKAAPLSEKGYVHVSPPVDADEHNLIEHYSRIIGSRYELKKMVGRGGMGLLFHAYDRQLGMDVAIKFLLDRFANDDMAVKSLKREAKAAMKLAHPNIIRLYNFEETARAKYLLMEFVEGESLASMASRRPDRRFTEAEVMKYVPEICEALKYAHSEGIIHRDIKPSNILIASDHRVKLTDFGIAFISEAEVREVGGGTPVYMSPEQIFGQPMDGRSDIYSLGITMYEMLAGNPPFRGREVSLQHLHVIPKPIDGICLWMNTLVLKCLRKEAEGRWRDAAELKDVLTGKKDIGIPMQGKYLPWWLRDNQDVQVGSPRVSVAPDAGVELRPPELTRAEVYKKPAPDRSARVMERVRMIEKRSDLAEHDPDREHTRMALGTLAGIVAGLVVAGIEKDSRWPLSHNMLFQLSLLLYGGLIGASIGIAHKSVMRGLLSFAMGIAGGGAAIFILKSRLEMPSLVTLSPSYQRVLCGSVLGAFLGIADGIYEKSFRYLLNCLLWGAIGGALGFTASLGVYHVFAAIWSPPLDWIMMGAALGFFVNMTIGFVGRPFNRP